MISKVRPVYDQNFYGGGGGGRVEGGNSKRCLNRGGNLEENYLKGGRRGKARHCR